MSYSNPRINLDMSVMDMLMAISGGNPSALTVLMQMVKDGATIDPDSALGGLSGILALDNLDCYGPRIWCFYKDVCGENISRMLAVLRGIQLGIAPVAAVNAAIDGQRASLNIDEVLSAVRKELPDFVMPNAEPSAQADAA